MVYAKAFFDLQLQFAHKVTDLSRLPFARVLLEYTNLYVRFGWAVTLILRIRPGRHT